MLDSAAPPPTAKQLAYLRTLSDRTGTTFSVPATRRQASRAIASLLARRRSSQLEIAFDLAAVRGGEIREAA